MKAVVCFRLALAVCVSGIITHLAEARGGGGRGGGGGGGGARMSAARAGAARSMPSNYGSMRSTPSRSYSATPQRSRSDIDMDQYRGESRTYDTRRGGEVSIGVSDSGDVGIRGETAGGRDYAAADISGGDRWAAGQGQDGDIRARYRDDGDGVIETLPHGYNSIYHNGYPYYYHDDHYYWPYYYGGVVYYQEVYPPYGMEITALPEGAESVVIDGVTYYVYDDVYYVRDESGYVVSNPPAGAAVNEDGKPSAAGIMKSMCDHLGTYTNFVLECTEQLERPGKGRHTVKRSITVNRPDRMIASGSGGTDTGRIWYDGKTVSVLDVDKNVYAQIPAPPDLPGTLDILQNEHSMVIPLSDLLSPEICNRLGEEIDSMTYEGEEKVGEATCHVLKLKTFDYSARLWIDAADGKPIPRKIDILYMSGTRNESYQAVIDRLETTEPADPALFVFEPPAGAQRIEILKRVE